MAAYFEGQHETDANHPPVLTAPRKMTKEQWERHRTTHTPYDPACQHCVVARAVVSNHPSNGRHNHLVPDTDGKLVGPTTASLDHMYLHERQEKGHDSDQNPPHMIMIEHKHGRVWTYRVPNNGTNAEASWLPKRIIPDWDNVGFSDAAIQLKIDQAQLQTAIQIVRQASPIPINSPVGESECNGRIENAIKRAQEKTRALRHQLGMKTGKKLQDNASIMAWLLRWVAELRFKYTMGDDGGSPRTKGFDRRSV